MIIRKSFCLFLSFPVILVSVLSRIASTTRSMHFGIPMRPNFDLSPILCICLLLSFSSVYAQCSFDADPGATIGSGNSANFSGAIGNSFVACGTGTLNSIGILATANASGLTITIYQGSGRGGANLGSVTGASVTAAGAFTDRSIINFSSAGISLTSGQTYTWSVTTGTISTRATNSSVYADGIAFSGATGFASNDFLFSVDIGAAAANTAPTASSFTATGGPVENQTFTFATSDFNYNDTDGDPLDHVLIEATPAAGTLYVDADNDDTYDGGEELSANDQVSKADLDAGNLQYIQNGTTNTSFQFEVNDGTDNSTGNYVATLNMTAAVSASASVTSALNCNGDTDGQVTASPSGGTSPYTYSWNTGETNATETNLGAGTYSVTITDQNGATDSASVTLTQPTAIFASASVTSALDCNGDTDGQVTASPSGGTSPYTYSWNTGETNAIETNLGAGTYSVTITDQNGCTDSASVTLTQPTVVIASASVTSAIDCNGDTDGQITASPSGGTSPYTYSWNTGETNAIETNLGAGTYSVTITDQNGCTDSASVTLTQPTVIIASASVTSALDCNGDTDGQLTANPSGGTSPYTYSWNTGETNAIETNLGAGTYSVTITDQNGCTDSASVTLTQPSSLNPGTISAN